MIPYSIPSILYLPQRFGPDTKLATVLLFPAGLDSIKQQFSSSLLAFPIKVNAVHFASSSHFSWQY